MLLTRALPRLSNRSSSAVAQAKTEAEKVEELEMVCCLTNHHIRSSKTAVQSRIVYIGMRLTRQPRLLARRGEAHRRGAGGRGLRTQ